MNRFIHILEESNYPNVTGDRIEFLSKKCVIGLMKQILICYLVLKLVDNYLKNIQKGAINLFRK